MKENRNEQIEEIKSALDIDNKVIQPISFVDYNKYTDNDVQMTYTEPLNALIYNTGSIANCGYVYNSFALKSNLNREISIEAGMELYNYIIRNILDAYLLVIENCEVNRAGLLDGTNIKENVYTAISEDSSLSFTSIRSATRYSYEIANVCSTIARELTYSIAPYNVDKETYKRDLEQYCADSILLICNKIFAAISYAIDDSINLVYNKIQFTPNFNELIERGKKYFNINNKDESFAIAHQLSVRIKNELMDDLNSFMSMALVIVTNGILSITNVGTAKAKERKRQVRQYDDEYYDE